MDGELLPEPLDVLRSLIINLESHEQRPKPRGAFLVRVPSYRPVRQQQFQVREVAKAGGV